MLTLYPAIKPYARHILPVSGHHELYLEESGNPEGIPVLYLHGGPGGSCDKHTRRFFDPNLYRIIAFDQRGCGRSRPYGELENNTTAHLLEDMEAIRAFLKVDKWMLFGGSWGSTLALLYAIQHPEKVLAMVLRGIWLARERDIDWLYRDGANRVFPDYWQTFSQPIPEAERGDMLSAFYARLTGSDELARMAAAKAWCLWEGHCATLRPSQEVLDGFSDPHRALAMARIASHYMINKAFIEENEILEQCQAISSIPGIIVHGRYDMVCPLENAQTLQQHWLEAELHIVRDAGHSAKEAGIRDALVRATDEMGKRFGKEFGLDKTS
ncbi:MAG: prolyl aminopeptidase [Oceanospirillales bacterium LUC14_002_19_P2]|nr:MAG: prolyl aminopeptidase [Oceanospirillales bacterium LUC14_002_19_P2]